MTEPTPYDRARTLLDAGKPQKDVVRELVAQGLDPESAAVIVSALAGKQPLPLEEMGEVGLGLEGASFVVRWDEDTIVDAQLNLVFGAFAALVGVATVVLWANGIVHMALPFGLVCLALARVSLKQIWGSVIRVAVAVAVAVWAVRGEVENYLGMLLGLSGQVVNYLACALLTFAVGAFYATRGLVVITRFQSRVHQRMPHGPSAEAPSAAAVAVATTEEPPDPALPSP